MSETSKKNAILEPELEQRIKSAIVLLIVTIFLSWFGGLPFILMCIALSFVLFYEWQGLVRVTPFDGADALLTGGFVVVLFCALFGYVVYGVLAYLLLGLILELTSTGQEKDDVRWIGLGGLYCSIPAIALPIIRFDGGFSLLMFLFLVVWATDIAAYFAGRHFGGAKLLPAVSPKKTWSGALGGLAGALGIALIFIIAVPGFGGFGTLVLACVLSIAAQIGDLFESWVKRQFGAKDSSQLIPGHGGFLDRVDGLIGAAIPLALMVALNSA